MRSEEGTATAIEQTITAAVRAGIGKWEGEGGWEGRKGEDVLVDEEGEGGTERGAVQEERSRSKEKEGEALRGH